MRVVFAPDKFAGTLSAVEAGDAMARVGRDARRVTSWCRCRCPTAGPGSSTYSTRHWGATCTR